MLTVGLIGAGRIGRIHANTIVQYDGSQLVAVADSVYENAKNLAKTYGVNPTSVDEIFKDSSIESILIASSTDTHSDFIEKASKDRVKKHQKSIRNTFKNQFKKTVKTLMDF